MLPDEEENAVRQLGQHIGYGRTMQLCEQLWRRMDQKGMELSVGPCAGMLVACPCPEVQSGAPQR